MLFFAEASEVAYGLLFARTISTTCTTYRLILEPEHELGNLLRCERPPAFGLARAPVLAEDALQVAPAKEDCAAPKRALSTSRTNRAILVRAHALFGHSNRLPTAPIHSTLHTCRQGSSPKCGNTAETRASSPTPHTACLPSAWVTLFAPHARGQALQLRSSFSAASTWSTPKHTFRNVHADFVWPPTDSVAGRFAHSPHKPACVVRRTGREGNVNGRDCRSASTVW